VAANAAPPAAAAAEGGAPSGGAASPQPPSPPAGEGGPAQAVLPERWAWAERVAAHLEAAHPVLGALAVTPEHLLGLRLSTLSAAQLDAAEAFAAQQSRALRDAQLALALAAARAEAAEVAERARDQGAKRTDDAAPRA
jgi:hypothetical protein